MACCQPWDFRRFVACQNSHECLVFTPTKRAVGVNLKISSAGIHDVFFSSSERLVFNPETSVDSHLSWTGASVWCLPLVANNKAYVVRILRYRALEFKYAFFYYHTFFILKWLLFNMETSIAVRLSRTATIASRVFTSAKGAGRFPL